MGHRNNDVHQDATFYIHGVLSYKYIENLGNTSSSFPDRIMQTSEFFFNKKPYITDEVSFNVVLLQSILIATNVCVGVCGCMYVCPL